MPADDNLILRNLSEYIEILIDSKLTISDVFECSICLRVDDNILILNCIFLLYVCL